MPVFQRISELQAELTVWRRDIHAHPELGFEDPVAYVRDFGSKIPNARPSVLLDLLLKKKSEIDVINGSIPRVGREVGVSAPVNEAITALVREKERRLGCA